MPTAPLDLIIDYENTAGHGNTLKIQARSSSPTLTAGVRFNAWDIDKDDTPGFFVPHPGQHPGLPAGQDPV